MGLSPRAVAARAPSHLTHDGMLGVKTFEDNQKIVGVAEVRKGVLNKQKVFDIKYQTMPSGVKLEGSEDVQTS